MLVCLHGILNQYVPIQYFSDSLKRFSPMRWLARSLSLSLFVSHTHSRMPRMAKNWLAHNQNWIQFNRVRSMPRTHSSASTNYNRLRQCCHSSLIRSAAQCLPNEPNERRIWLRQRQSNEIKNWKMKNFVWSGQMFACTTTDVSIAFNGKDILLPLAAYSNWNRSKEEGKRNVNIFII